MSTSQYLKDGFAGCRHLGKARDYYANCEVTLYALPGNHEYVGVTDGERRWIAPALDNLFSVAVTDLLRRRQGGGRIRVKLISASAT